MREIYRASGKDLGGDEVDKAFVKNLEKVFGLERIQKIRQKNPKAWLQVLEDFEQAKKIASTYDANDLVYLHSSRDCSWGHKSFRIRRALNRGKSDIKLKRDGRLFFSQNTILKIIQTLSYQIEDFIAKVLNDLELNSVNAILLVGGFAKSPFIREAMEKLVDSEIPIIEPENSELCVVKGAVLFGWKTDIIKSRKSRYTYGFGGSREFNNTEDDLTRRRTDNNGKHWCKNCFHKLISINDDLPEDSYVDHTAFHPHNDFMFTSISLFCTEDPNPKYFDVDGVELVGEIKLPKRKHSNGTEILLRLFFGDTEIHLETTETATGNTLKTKFDVLPMK